VNQYHGSRLPDNENVIRIYIFFIFICFLFEIKPEFNNRVNLDTFVADRSLTVFPSGIQNDGFLNGHGSLVVITDSLNMFRVLPSSLSPPPPNALPNRGLK